MSHGVGRRQVHRMVPSAGKDDNDDHIDKGAWISKASGASSVWAAGVWVSMADGASSTRAAGARLLARQVLYKNQDVSYQALVQLQQGQGSHQNVHLHREKRGACWICPGRSAKSSWAPPCASPQKRLKRCSQDDLEDQHRSW